MTTHWVRGHARVRRERETVSLGAVEKPLPSWAAKQALNEHVRVCANCRAERFDLCSNADYVDMLRAALDE